ncbi:phage major capsid protein [Sphingomonas sp. ERG5]|uniref:phage major capsid protein n=1 Tax=Sphingomonas sp. ERG5 TaxID=1381597 RepID=UPI00054B5E9F|nr:phage major capsid protein [Sphingomonas sp. ERG5]
MSVANLTLKEAREKLGAKQDELGKVFAEAKADGGYDFSKVTCLGTDVKGSISVAEKVKAMNAECDELAQHAETLEAAEHAVKSHADREKGVRRPPMPGGSKGDDRRGEIKSLGQRVGEEKAYQSWARGGAAGGISFSYEEAWPSDMLAKGAAYETLGTKTLMTRSAGYAPEVIRAPGFVEAPTRPIQVLDIIPMFQTDQAAYKYMEETARTHASAERAEGGTFAESTFGFTERNSPVQKITDSLPVTDEQLQDVPSMNGYIDSRLTFGIRQRFDSQCVVGDGLDPNLRGLKNVAGIQTQAVGGDPVMDAFFKSMTKVRLIGRATPTHHLMHPLDWQNIRLTRTADGVYIFGSPTDAGPERLWGLPVVQEDADVQGRGYTGSFLPPFVSLFERQGVEIQIGFVGTQFVEGKRTVRGTMRAALVWFRPTAFAEVTGIPG